MDGDGAMIHIVDDYILLAGSTVAIIWGIVAVCLTPSMVRRTASGGKELLTSLWLARNLVVVFAGLIVLGVITTLGTENSVAQISSLLAGLTLIVLVLLTVPRAYQIMPTAGKIGVLLDLLAAILILFGSMII